MFSLSNCYKFNNEKHNDFISAGRFEIIAARRGIENVATRHIQSKRGIPQNLAYKQIMLNYHIIIIVGRERTHVKMQPQSLVVAFKLTLLSQIRARFDLAFWAEN